MKRANIIWLFNALSLLNIPSSAQNTQQNNPPVPNWARPHIYDSSKPAYRNRASAASSSNGQLAFTFTFAEFERTTSAGVFDASGSLARTLWSNRAYKAGA